MKRLVLSVCLCGLLAGLAAPSSFGFAAGFDYVGQAQEPHGSVGFFVGRSASGGKLVTGFTVTGVPYECSDAAAGITAGWRFKPRMPVKSREFEGRGDWVGLPLDPVGRVGGKLRRGGVAVGQLKLRGELAGPGTHCHTGLLDWRATKNPL